MKRSTLELLMSEPASNFISVMFAHGLGTGAVITFWVLWMLDIIALEPLLIALAMFGGWLFIAVPLLCAIGAGICVSYENSGTTNTVR